MTESTLPKLNNPETDSLSPDFVKPPTEDELL